MDIKIYKVWFISVLSSIIFILFIAGLVNFIVDPLQQYRKASLYTPYCDENKQIYLNPGLAKTHEYDTIIIGSSVTENFFPSKIKNKLGFQAIKLSLSGASAYEERLIIQTAIQTKKVRNVIFGLDFYPFSGDPERLREGKKGTPFYLYDSNYWNDYKYLLSLDTLRYIISTISYNFDHHPNLENSMERCYYWGDKFEFSADAVRKGWRENRRQDKIRPRDFKFQILKKSFEINILPIIKQHADIQFYIFYPPYSILEWQFYKNKGMIDDLIEFKHYIFKVSSDFPNVRLYDFQALKNITHNFRYYKDLNHYSPIVDDFIIEAFVSGNYRVTVEREPLLSRELRTQIDSFNINSFYIETNSGH